MFNCNTCKTILSNIIENTYPSRYGTDVVYRFYTKDDWIDEETEERLAYLKKELLLDTLTDEEALSRIRRIRLQEHYVVGLALVDDYVVGYCTAYGDDFKYFSMYLDNLAVDRKYNGNGIATKLLDILYDICKDMGRTYIWLNASEEARPLYHRCGYNKLETTREGKYKMGKWIEENRYLIQEENAKKLEKINKKYNKKFEPLPFNDIENDEYSEYRSSLPYNSNEDYDKNRINTDPKRYNNFFDLNLFGLNQRPKTKEELEQEEIYRITEQLKKLYIHRYDNYQSYINYIDYKNKHYFKGTVKL